MANQEQLDILKQGVEVWNQWRKEHLDIRPDLGRANLISVGLRGANLSFSPKMDRYNKQAALISQARMLRSEVHFNAHKPQPTRRQFKPGNHRWKSSPQMQITPIRSLP